MDGIGLHMYLAYQSISLLHWSYLDDYSSNDRELHSVLDTWFDTLQTAKAIGNEDICCSPSFNSASKDQPGTFGRVRKLNRSNSKINKICEPEVETPSDSESVGDEVVGHGDSDVDQSSLDVERADGLTPVARIALQAEANSLY